MILLLNVGAMVLLVLVDALVRPARVLVAVAAADPARSLLPRLLGVGPILAGPHSGIRTHDLALNPKQISGVLRSCGPYSNVHFGQKKGFGVVVCLDLDAMVVGMCVIVMCERISSGCSAMKLQ